MGVLRLFLALSVVAAHAGSSVAGLPVVDANVAVQLFFMISGFYMAMVLNGKYRDAPIVAFYLNRVLRLFPVYLIGTAFALVVGFGAIAAYVGTLRGWGPAWFVGTNLLIVGQDLSYLVCVPTTTGCGSPYFLSINPPAWTLAAELAFYAVAPFIVRSPRRILALIATGIGFLVVVGLLSQSVYGPQGSAPHLVPENAFVLGYYFLPSSFLFFGLGALAQRVSTGAARFPYWPLLALAVASVFTHTPMPVWQAFVFAAAIPAVFRATRSNRVDRLVGELSYPVYILHFPVLDALRAALPESSWVLSPAWLGTVTGVLCLLAGLVVHATVESAATRFRHSLIRRPPRDGTGAPASVGTLRRRLLPVAVVALYFGVPALLLAWLLVHQQPAPVS